MQIECLQIQFVLGVIDMHIKFIFHVKYHATVKILYEKKIINASQLHKLIREFRFSQRLNIHINQALKKNIFIIKIPKWERVIK